MNKKLFIVILFLIPLVVISFICKDKTNFYLKETPIIEEQLMNEDLLQEQEITIKLKDNDKIIDINLEDYVIGVVACEMPASYDMEALKAQAVAARTFVLRKLEISKKKYTITNGTSDQCYHDKSVMKNKWGKNYNKYYEKIKEAVLSTKNEYMLYKDEIIVAFYFSTSNGYTEYSENVFVSSKPYLKSVSSVWDKENKDYEKTIKLSEKEFLSKLNQSTNTISNIKIISRYKSNRVNKIKINNETYTGVEFRTNLNLRSTDFDIEERDGYIYITTRGYGHGVGMSQYGAYKMATMGYKYDEILKYYYKNINIKKYKL